MTGLAGKRVVITAGGGGIGATLARRFAAEGAKVAVCDLDGAAAEAVAAEIDGLGMGADVTDEAQMQAFFDAVDGAFGGVDVLCANAGTGGPAAPIEDIDYAAWQACLSSNLDGAFLACRWAARHMKAQGSGRIILTSSTSGLFGVPTRAPYVAAKWGIIGLTKTLAMELGPHGITANAICPGAVDGDRMERVVAMEAHARGVPADEVRTLYAEGTSMRTWVNADDIADSALYLASHAAKKVSGQVLAVDGHTERMT
ncbi:SDR family oxidoreductase [Gymnodinialimonas hymeniacidonis]|uniref:SDR family oxidoreductase n=1 Tax=Gymnodinialimonas hymeniacidonis TaxID=3126508 RepID=UPI0034C5ECBD